MTTYSTRTIDDILSRDNRSATYKKVLTAWLSARSETAEGSERRALHEAVSALDAASYPTVRDWEDRTETTRHETAAWVDLMKEAMDEQVLGSSKLLWQGLTSSNLMDTADALIYAQAEEYICDNARVAAGQLLYLPIKPRVGRTHGQRAEITRNGNLWRRVGYELQYVGTPGLTGAFTGPTGDGDSQVSARACARLHVHHDAYATQTTSRIRYADVAWSLYRIVGMAAQVGMNIRLLAREGLATEGFVEGEQKGSSSMPHKRNPIRSERLCGLERVARGHLAAVAETGFTQWEERDLTNSSVERESFWGLVRLAGFASYELTQTLRGLALFEDGEVNIYQGTAEQLAAGQPYYELQQRTVRDAGGGIARTVVEGIKHDD